MEFQFRLFGDVRAPICQNLRFFSFPRQKQIRWPIVNTEGTKKQAPNIVTILIASECLPLMRNKLKLKWKRQMNLKKKLAKAINLVRLLPFFQVRSLQCLRRDAAIVMV